MNNHFGINIPSSSQPLHSTTLDPSLATAFRRYQNSDSAPVERVELERGRGGRNYSRIEEEATADKCCFYFRFLLSFTVYICFIGIAFATIHIFYSFYWGLTSYQLPFILLFSVRVVYDCISIMCIGCMVYKLYYVNGLSSVSK